jgi:hypothetical protein
LLAAVAAVRGEGTMDITVHHTQVTAVVVVLIPLAPQVSQEVSATLLLSEVVVDKTQMVLTQVFLEQALAFLVLEAEAAVVTEEQVLLVL